MSAETLAPIDSAAVARLVAAEFAAHQEHLLQRFARDVERTLLAMRPPVHDAETWAAAASLESAARVTLRLAGLDSEQIRTVLNAPERNGTHQSGDSR